LLLREENSGSRNAIDALARLSREVVMGIAMAIFAFLLGGLLLFFALVGGGFQVRELRVPQVGWAHRAMSLLLAAVFIGAGILLNTGSSDATQSVAPPVAAESTTAAVEEGDGPIHMRESRDQQAAVEGE
jgi:hypothetical protein